LCYCAVDPISVRGLAEEPNETMKKILIIDDDPQINEVLKIFFVKLGYAAETVRSGQDAIEKIKTQQFWAVICDFTMFGLNGMEIYDIVREFQPDLCARFVLSTGTVLDQAAEIKAAKQKIKILGKPFHFDHIKQLLREIEERGP
jgi:DNA-binding NtrC family response regulator